MTTRPVSLLFAHGWGYDASLWDGIRARLPDVPAACIERGYLGAAPARPIVPGSSIAVGHSAGMLDLLDDPPSGCVAIVSINGFTRFTAAPDFPPGLPRRVLDRMLVRLDADPDATLSAFRQRCGDGAPGPTGIRPEPLRDGLLSLRDGDLRLRAARLGLPILALAGAADPVVPSALTRGCFQEAWIRWHGAPGHLLPLTAPDWCAARLRVLLVA